jgi:hypothetical protein
MRRVCVVCEGQTEETFVRDVLAPAFYPLNLNLVPEMIETSPGYITWYRHSLLLTPEKAAFNHESGFFLP